MDGVAVRAVATKRVWAAALSAAWLLGLVASLASVVRYKTSPGAEGPTPARWPEASTLPHSPGRNTLVLFLHPECPSSRASLAEFNWLMNDALVRETTDGVVVFAELIQPPDPHAPFSSWARAAEVPNTVRRLDVDGAEAARFGALTGGHAALYDGDGALRYSGGLTNSRGHQGDNVGRRSVLAVVTGSGRAAPHRPVYGCALHDPTDATEEPP